MTEARTVTVTNLNSATTEESLRNFFEFCGVIESVKVGGGEATIVFKGEKAAKTAVLLSNGQIDGNTITVTGGDGVTAEHTDKIAEASQTEEPSATTGNNNDNVNQEHKPKSAIMAELLANGYVLGDQVIQRGIDIDKKHGFSERFTSWFNALIGRGKQWDEQTKATEKATDFAQKVDERTGAQDKAKQAYRVGKDYYEKALQSPMGSRVHAFYSDVSKQINDVHAEAARIAESKKSQQGGETSSANQTTTSTDVSTEAKEKAS